MDNIQYLQHHVTIMVATRFHPTDFTILGFGKVVTCADGRV